MIPEIESSTGAYRHVLDGFQRRLGHERTLFAREELVIIHEFDRISVSRTTQTPKTGPSSNDEGLFYQDLTETDLSEADLAAHQAFAKAMDKGKSLVRQVNAYDKARPHFMQARKILLDGRGFEAYAFLPVHYNLTNIEMAATYNNGVEIAQPCSHLDAAEYYCCQAFEAPCRMPKSWAKKPEIRVLYAFWLEIRAKLDARANMKPKRVRELKKTAIRSIEQVAQELQESKDDVENLQEYRKYANTWMKRLYYSGNLGTWLMRSLCIMSSVRKLRHSHHVTKHLAWRQRDFLR